MELNVVNQLNLIGSIKFFTKLNWFLYMKERLKVFKKLCAKNVTLMNNYLEIYRVLGINFFHTIYIVQCLDSSHTYFLFYFEYTNGIFDVQHWLFWLHYLTSLNYLTYLHFLTYFYDSHQYIDLFACKDVSITHNYYTIYLIYILYTKISDNLFKINGM